MDSMVFRWLGLAMTLACVPGCDDSAPGDDCDRCAIDGPCVGEPGCEALPTCADACVEQGVEPDADGSPDAASDAAVDAAPDADSRCDAESCDPDAGAPPLCAGAPDGTACADDNPCTVDETCQGGVCTAGGMVACPSMGQCWTAGRCDAKDGCVFEPRPAGTPCGDPARACFEPSACDGAGSCAAGRRTPGACSLALGEFALKLTGEVASGLAGRNVSAAGDLDRDGVDDIVVGAQGVEEGRGAVYVVTGPVVRSGPLADAAVRLTGDVRGGRAGYAVAGAGDVDGDGQGDLVIGAPHLEEPRDESAAFIALGPFDRDRPLAERSLAYRAEQEADYVGSHVATVGDVNRDGFDDVVIGAHGLDLTAVDQGGAYLVSGGPALLADGSIQRSDAAVRGGYGRASLGGLTIENVGDLDGDGRADLAVSGHDRGGAHTSVFVFFSPLRPGATLADADARIQGHSFYFGHHIQGGVDVNADGHLDLLVGAPLDETGGAGAGVEAGAAYLFLGPIIGEIDQADAAAAFIGGPGDRAGHAVACLHLDADGALDVALGAVNEGTAANDVGHLYVVRGPFAAVTPLEDADTVRSGVIGDFLGYDLAIGGDLTGDGEDDLLIGAPNDAEAGENAGAVYVLPGRSL